jgi:hypothetical protein
MDRRRTRHVDRRERDTPALRRAKLCTPRRSRSRSRPTVAGGRDTGTCAVRPPPTDDRPRMHGDAPTRAGPMRRRRSRRPRSSRTGRFRPARGRTMHPATITRRRTSSGGRGRSTCASRPPRNGDRRRMHLDALTRAVPTRRDDHEAVDRHEGNSSAPRRAGACHPRRSEGRGTGTRLASTGRCRPARDRHRTHAGAPTRAGPVRRR